ncbi:MAG TPA: FtsX-like permease family protein, partial [Opitutaceae bacterium]|nr:FtsX-like permease family protein [Opitutaceae bacterium]
MSVNSLYRESHHNLSVPAGPLSWVLLRKTAFRHWRTEPRQTALLVLILALGVAVFLSVRLANRAAVASFQNFTDTLTGQSDWLIKAPAGTLPVAVLTELRDKISTLPVHVIPVVETTAAAPARKGDSETRWSRTSYQLLGLDLVGLPNLPIRSDAGQPFLTQSSDSSKDNGMHFWDVFRSGAQVYISPVLAAAKHLKAGAHLDLIINEKVVNLPIAGVIPSSPDGPQIPENLLVLDLPALQTLTGKLGRLDRVEFVVEPGIRAAEIRNELKTRLEVLGKDRWTVTSPGARRETAEAMTRAFRLNLTVLSLIALLVGLYLILQALDGAVVRRRGEIAILRSLGVREGEIRFTWLLEAAMLGLVGGAVGLLLGWLGAQFSVRFVGQTVNALYYATTVKAAHLHSGEALIALALSAIASITAGWLPANEAARTPPAQILVRHAGAAEGQTLLRNYGFALALIVAGVALTQLPPLRFAGGGRFPLAGYIAAFLWIFGGGIFCALGLPLIAHLGGSTKRKFVTVRLALSHLKIPSGRHRLAVACLLCAIGMTAGMAILVASFEQTVRGWVARSLQADLYISSDGAQS